MNPTAWIIAKAALKVLATICALIATLGAVFVAYVYVSEYWQIDGGAIAAGLFGIWLFCYMTWQTAKEDIEHEEKRKRGE